VSLAVVAGVIYTWYTGQHATIKNEATPVTKVSQPTTTQPEKLAPNDREGVAEQSFTSPVQQGDNASVDIQTNPDSTCSITAVYNNVTEKDSGLAPKTADEYGLVEWSWTVSSSAPVGTWPITINCVWNKKSAVLIENLVIQK
jgi:hypothetical protein